jgi:hypothetical protein
MACGSKEAGGVYLPARTAQASAVPGMVGATQTFGQLIRAHPHIHTLVSEQDRFRPISP